MKRKASVSHDEAIVRRLRKDSDFAAEYLKAALEDGDEPGVLLIALRTSPKLRASPGRQGRRHRAREPLPGIVSPRQPSPVHLVCRYQGHRAQTHRRSRSINRGWRKHYLLCMRPRNPGNISVTASYP